MRNVVPSALVVVSLAATLAAQGRVALAPLSEPRISLAFQAGRLGGVFVRRILMVPHPSGAPGLFLGSARADNLPQSLGGSGGSDVVAFTYDRATDTVTLNANAAALNTPAEEVGLAWSPDGTYAILDRGTGEVLQARASSPGGALGAPTPVNALGPSWTGEIPGRIGGAPVLFFVDQTGLVWRSHDVARSSLTGPTSLVMPQVPAATGFLSWPFVLHGRDGDVEAALAAVNKRPLGQSPLQWLGDLDPASTPVEQSTGTVRWIDQACEAGGRLYLDSVFSGLGIVEMEVAGLLGDTIGSAGDLLDLTTFAPIRSAGPTDLSVVLFGGRFLAAPLSIPGVNHLFGLDPAAGVSVLGIAVHALSTGRGELTIRTPPLPVGTLPLQAVTFLGAGPAALAFTSTTSVQVVP